MNTIYLLTEYDNDVIGLGNNDDTTKYHYFLCDDKLVLVSQSTSNIFNNKTYIKYDNKNDNMEHFDFEHGYDIFQLPEQLFIIPMLDKIKDLFVLLENKRFELIINNL
jgi:hypothetical protein